MQISIELSETSKVQLAKPIRWKNVDDKLVIQYLKWKVQNAIGFL